MLFSVIRHTPRYYSKNFYKEIGLSRHFTLQGFLLRIQRRYPILFRFTKFAFIFISVAATSLVLVSGSSLPLQREIKQTAIRGVERLGRRWYLDQTEISNGHNIISYIDFIYRIIWYTFDNGLGNTQILTYYLSLVNDAVQNNMMSIKKSQQCSVSINQISYSISLINKLFQAINNSKASNFKKQSLQTLKNKQFLFEYNRIIDNIVQFNNRQASEIEEKYKKQYKNLFTIFQYLLKFQDPEQKIKILEKMSKLLAQERVKFMCDALQQGEEPLKRELKKLYAESESYQSLIMSIIKRVEQNRREKEENKKKS